MKSRERRNRGPGHHPETAVSTQNIQLPTSHHHSADVIHLTASNPDVATADSSVDVQVAEVVARDQRRKYPATIVRSCSCGSQHMHRGLGLRHAPCGATYLVVAS